MPLPSNLVEIIESLDAAEWSGTTYRHTSKGRDPLSGFGAMLAGGRWNPPGSFPTLYLATTIESCVAEFFRMAEGQARGPSSLLPRHLHEVAVSGLQVFDLAASGHLDALGLRLADIASEDRTACHEIALAAHSLKLEGVLAPSATGSAMCWQSSKIVLQAASYDIFGLKNWTTT